MPSDCITRAWTESSLQVARKEMEAAFEAANSEHNERDNRVRSCLLKALRRLLSRFMAMFLYEVAVDYQGIVIVRHKEVRREQASGPGVIPYNFFTDQRYRYDLRVAATVILANEPMATRDKLEVVVTISQCGNFQNLSEATRYSVNKRYGQTQGPTNKMPGKELLTTAKEVIGLYTLKELILNQPVVELHMQRELAPLFLREGYNLQRIYIYAVASEQLERFLAAPTVEMYNARAERVAANADLHVLKSLKEALEKKTYFMRHRGLY